MGGHRFGRHRFAGVHGVHMGRGTPGCFQVVLGHQVMGGGCYCVCVCVGDQGMIWGYGGGLPRPPL